MLHLPMVKLSGNKVPIMTAPPISKAGKILNSHGWLLQPCQLSTIEPEVGYSQAGDEMPDAFSAENDMDDVRHLRFLKNTSSIGCHTGWILPQASFQLSQPRVWRPGCPPGSS